ncbi:phosphoglycerate mutase [Paenibacillus sp. J23TS9]|uniref:histidine phosphatase family protein n=1 Tax=Paenibacillus sp. J23TS9 TaxID=2807193 RepID=UPI001B29D999|nr:histidine phosphatase family protein [Paenibacillus sp. J23TS9]GIP27170.1 phosphoglycerate mutase [Paenibacillus sp. J23TS9]
MIAVHGARIAEEAVVIQTVIYMVRHAESKYIPGMEEARGLSEKGMKDALFVRDILRTEDIDAFFSSPYQRAIQTVEPSAREAGGDIILIEDLKERTLAGEDFHVPEGHFFSCKKQLYDDFHFTIPGGESSSEAQYRGSQVILKLLEEHRGKKIAIGTHGDIMTLIMNYFNREYDFEFWRSTSMPDVYKLAFEDKELKQVTRCWAE